jgi:hypothetical protein
MRRASVSHVAHGVQSSIYGMDDGCGERRRGGCGQSRVGA